MKKIVLENPILVNGNTVSELSYNTDKITTAQFIEACAKSAAIDKTRAVTLKLKENDYALHMYLGCMAIIADNPQIDITDLERITGTDILKLVNIGMVFTIGKSEDYSEENSSEEQSENTVVTSIPVSEK